jgi:hypothetical protein
VTPKGTELLVCPITDTTSCTVVVPAGHAAPVSGWSPGTLNPIELAVQLVVAIGVPFMVS